MASSASLPVTTGPAPGTHTGAVPSGSRKRKRGEAAAALPPLPEAAAVPPSPGTADANAHADAAQRQFRPPSWRQKKSEEKRHQYRRGLRGRRDIDVRTELQAREYNSAGWARTKDWLMPTMDLTTEGSRGFRGLGKRLPPQKSRPGGGQRCLEEVDGACHLPVLL